MFLKNGNTSSKVRQFKNEKFEIIMVSQDKRASLWLSFDTKRAKVLPLVTELGASEGKRYNIHFFQVFNNQNPEQHFKK